MRTNEITEGWFTKKSPAEKEQARQNAEQKRIKLIAEVVPSNIDHLIQQVKKNKITRANGTHGWFWPAIEQIIKNTGNQDLIDQVDEIDLYFRTWPQHKNDVGWVSAADPKLIKEFIQLLQKLKEDFIKNIIPQLTQIQSTNSSDNQQAMQPSVSTVSKNLNKDNLGRIEPTLESIKHLAGLTK